MRLHLLVTILSLSLVVHHVCFAQCEAQTLANDLGLLHYGSDVAVGSGFIAVGAPIPGFPLGAVRIFRSTPNGWNAQGSLVSSAKFGLGTNGFGARLAAAGDLLAVNETTGGVNKGGAVHLFRLKNGAFMLEQSYEVHGVLFGTAIAVDEDLLAVGVSDADTEVCPQGGKVILYRFNDGQWGLEAEIEVDYCSSPQPPLFGRSVATANDVLLIGDSRHFGPSNQSGAVFVHRNIKGNWIFDQMLKPSRTGSQHFGYSTAVDGSGTTAVIGAPNAQVSGGNQTGLAYVLEHDGAQWVETAVLKANPPMAFTFFGERVAISEDGNTILVVSQVGQQAHLFRRVGTQWTHIAVLPGAGKGVAFFGDTAAVASLDPSWSTQISVYAGMTNIDCNKNGVPDGCDIALGASQDVNKDGIPDECQNLPDLTGNGSVGVADLLTLLGAWGACADQPCPGDLNNDGIVGVADLLLLLAAWGPYPPPLPAPDCGSMEGDCCTAHNTPGCGDVACCGTVCAADPFCCDSNGQWDIICVHHARENCGCEIPATCGEARSGSCCIPGVFGNGTPGCDDPECCAIVCDYIDPSCCDVEWTDSCAYWAFNACESCPHPACGPNGSDCCVVGQGPKAGCLDMECCITICEQDPFCCNLWWDQICVNQAIIQCEVCQP